MELRVRHLACRLGIRTSSWAGRSHRLSRYACCWNARSARASWIGSACGRGRSGVSAGRTIARSGTSGSARSCGPRASFRAAYEGELLAVDMSALILFELRMRYVDGAPCYRAVREEPAVPGVRVRASPDPRPLSARRVLSSVFRPTEEELCRTPTTRAWRATTPGRSCYDGCQNASTAARICAARSRISTPATSTARGGERSTSTRRRVVTTSAARATPRPNLLHVLFAIQVALERRGIPLDGNVPSALVAHSPFELPIDGGSTTIAGRASSDD